MDSLSRLIARAGFLVLLFFASPAHAQFTYSIPTRGISGHTSAASACSAAHAKIAPTLPEWSLVTRGCPETAWQWRVTCIKQTGCGGKVPGYFEEGQDAVVRTGTLTCPAGQAPDPTGSFCVSTSGCPLAGQELAGVSVWGLPGPTTSTAICHNGCAANGAMVAASEGKWYVWGPFIASGSSCTGTSGPSTSTPTSPAPDPLKPGYCPGTVNGATVQVPCSTTQTTSSGSTSSSSTSASGVTSSGSGTSTSTTTTCTNGVCTSTTTNTTTNPDGSKTTVTGSETKPQEKDSFCRQNPTLSICKESSIGGACGAVSCSGDAIQCAIAREQAKRNCELIDTETTLSGIGRAAANGGDPADHPKNSQSSIAVNLSTMLDSTPLFGSANQCPADITITHDGKSFVLPFGTTLCPYLRLLGAAFLAACYLAAGFIVFGRS